MVMKISARVEIDARPAQKGAADASKAVASIGGKAEETSAQLAKLQRIAGEGLRPISPASGIELDRLRAKFNPLYAEISKYKQTQMEIRAANAAGALSTDEMTAALDRNRRAAMANIDALKGRNKAITETPVAKSTVANDNNARFAATNLAFQAQDIIATAGSMPWQTVALQQGPQVAGVLSTIDNKAQALRGALLGLISPWSLISVAAVGATAFAIQYFTSTGSEAEKSNEKLKEQRDLIAAVTKQWGDAVPALQAYVAELERQKQTEDLLKATNFAVDDKWKLARNSVQDLNVEFADLLMKLQSNGMDSGFLRELQTGWQDVSKGIKEGKTNAEAMKVVQDGLASAMATTGIASIESFAKSFSGLSDTIAGAIRQAGLFREQALQALITGKNGPALGQLSPLFTENGQFMSGKDFTPDTAPLPGKRPLRELEHMPGEQAAIKAGIRDTNSAANAYRDLIKTADDRVAQMKLEAQMAGQTGVASDALRFKLDLLQQSEDKGRSLTSSQVEAINKRVEAFKKYAEEAAKATLKADLLFEREQMGRSSMDQQIASGLRGAGLEIDFDSYEAGLIRTNLQLQYARELAGDFANTFFSSFEQGKSVLESLGDAGVSALKRIANTMLNDVLNSIFSVNSAASGLGGGGGFFSSLLSGFSGLFGGGSKFPSAPGGLYDKGGYTGHGGVHEPAGIVHRGEVVWSQRDVARAGGVAVVDAMRLGRRGYDDGGIVGVTPLLSPSRSASTQQQSQTLQLLLKLGVSVDESGNIMPLIKSVVAEDAQNIAVSVVESYDNQMPARMAQIQQDPLVR